MAGKTGPASAPHRAQAQSTATPPPPVTVPANTRPRRIVRAPTPLYVPDESLTFEDDLSTSPMTHSSGNLSIDYNTESIDGEDETDDDDDDDDESGERTRQGYLRDGFVVTDDEEDDDDEEEGSEDGSDASDEESDDDDEDETMSGSEDGSGDGGVDDDATQDSNGEDGESVISYSSADDPAMSDGSSDPGTPPADTSGWPVG